MKKSPKPCDCVTQVNAQLAESGQILTFQLAIDLSSGKSTLESPLLRVQWSGKPKRGRKLSVLICTYCPFCGKKKP